MDILTALCFERIYVKDVFYHGKLVVTDMKMINFEEPVIKPYMQKTIWNSFYLDELTAKKLLIYM